MLNSSKTIALNQLAWLVGLSLSTLLSAHAQTVSTTSTGSLKEVVISGSRSEQYLDDLPISMDVINAREIEDRQIGDIRDAAKYLPNVSVKRAPARFSVTGRGNPVGADGNAGFNIRGQGGNRVVMLIDGVRLPRSYINGSNAFGRDSVTIGLLKRIEVIHGPTSVLYGSDGLAGMVNFITLEPADFLTRSDGTAKAVGGKAWMNYSGDDQGATVGATVAARASDNAEWSITGTQSRSSALGNKGENDSANVDRTTPNPQSNSGDSLLAKLMFRPTAAQRHVLTVEHVHTKTEVDLLSSRVKTPVAIPLGYAALTAAQKAAAPAAAILGESSVKTMDRSRITWDALYRLNMPMADSVKTAVSWQDGSSQDNGQTVLKTAFANDGTRVRKTSYQERAWQGNVQAEKSMRFSPKWSQKLTYGFDYASVDISSFADGSDPAPLTPFVPKRYFPDTRDTSQAIYIQGELISDQWSIVPGVRFDQFSLDVLSQEGYFPGIASAAGKSLSGSAVSPKLGVLLRATPEFSVYGNYASGFRAPEGQQVNSALEVSTARLLPNPDLKPEESRNFEFGLRARTDRMTLDMAVFRATYSNLIVDKKDLGTANGLAASVANPTLFQTINIDKASIIGFEMKGSMAWGTFAGGKLSSPFSYGRTRGTNDSNGLPLNYIEPAKLTAGVKFETSSWDLRLDMKHHAEKTLTELDSVFIPRSTTQLQFTTPSSTTFDLSGQWRIRKDLRLNFAIVNLTDQKYWHWSDVQGLASNPVAPLLPVMDAYTQPGRHLNMSLVAEF